MPRRPAILHILAGLVLLVILVPLTGWIANFPLPQGLVDFVREKRLLANWASQVVGHVLPALIVCFVFGVVAFRLLREASGRAVAWVSAGVLVPLCGLQLAVMLLHGSGLAAFGNLFGNPIYWASIAPIPLGLWLAARMKKGRRSAP